LFFFFFYSLFLLSILFSYKKEDSVLARKKAYEEKIVKLIVLKEGTYTYDLKEDLIIKCPISIHGAGQTNTIIEGKDIVIKGPKKEKKRVNMQDFTMKGSNGHGLFAYNGLSFLCTRMTFTQCGWHGVSANNTKGRLINCVITQCRQSGILSSKNALIELEGDQTKVDGNNTSGWGGYGLKTEYTSSRIHLLFPLNKESVSTNNHRGGNYGGKGTIETVESLEKL
jgi:hypothetical protein